MSEFLKISKTFCILPWVHLYLNPDGKVYPCCISLSDTKMDVGNLATHSVTEVRNNEKMIEIRRRMMNGEEVPACKVCYEHESILNRSTRTDLTSDESITRGISASQLNSDGSLGDIPITYLDMRFSNLCNLECNTCGGQLSSKLAKRHGLPAEYLIELKKTGVVNADHIISLSNKKPNFFEDEIKPNLNSVSRIYIAGGEPFLHKENYELLTTLISQKKFNTRLTFNTNLTTTTFKSFDYLEALSQFDDVEILCSIDYFGKGLEHIRKNTNSDELFRNFERILSHKKFKVSIVSVVSVYNIYHICDFLLYLHSKGYTDQVTNLFFNMVVGDYHSPTILPNWAKKEIVENVAAGLKDPVVVELLKKFKWLETISQIPTWIYSKEPDQLMVDSLLHKLDEIKLSHNISFDNWSDWGKQLVRRLKLSKGTYCVNTHNSARIASDRSVRFCCLMTSDFVDSSGKKLLLDSTPLTTILNSEVPTEIRTALDNGVKHSACSSCWVKEESGIVSKRMYDNESMSDIIASGTTDLKYVEMNLGSTCNLKCRTCSPYSSVQWEKEWIEYSHSENVLPEIKEIVIGEMKKYRSTSISPALVESLKVSFETLEKIDLFGGEPFMIEQQWEILQHLVDIGAAKNQTVMLNTNATIYDEHKINILQQFKEVVVSLSIDGLSDQFNYIRKNAEWDSVLTNILKFANLRLPNKFTVWICCTVSTYNVYYAADVIEYFEKLNLYTSFNFVSTPDFLAIGIIPTDIKLAIIAKYQKIKQGLIHQHSITQIDNVINMLEHSTPNTEKWEKFIDRATYLDTRWNENYATTFPEFYKIISNSKI